MHKLHDNVFISWTFGNPNAVSNFYVLWRYGNLDLLSKLSEYAQKFLVHYGGYALDLNYIFT